MQKCSWLPFCCASRLYPPHANPPPYLSTLSIWSISYSLPILLSNLSLFSCAPFISPSPNRMQLRTCVTFISPTWGFWWAFPHKYPPHNPSPLLTAGCFFQWMPPHSRCFFSLPLKEVEEKILARWKKIISDAWHIVRSCWSDLILNRRIRQSAVWIWYMLLVTEVNKFSIRCHVTLSNNATRNHTGRFCISCYLASRGFEWHFLLCWIIQKTVWTFWLKLI